MPDDKPESQVERKHRRLWIGLAIAAGILVVLLVVPVLLLDSALVERQVKTRVLPRLSAQIGREVSIERLKVSVLPRPTARIDGFRLAGLRGGPPLVEAKRAEVTVKLLPLLLSFGKNVQLGSLQLWEPVVNLVRASDGTWSHEGLALGTSEREVLLERLQVEGGTLRLIDRAGQGRQTAVALTSIEAQARNLSRNEPFNLDLKASLASQSRNLRAQLSGALQTGVEGNVSASGVSLAAIRGLVPAGFGELLRDGKLSLKSRIAASLGGELRASGTVAVDGISLRGTPAEADLAFRAASAAGGKGLAVVLERLAIQGEAIDLRGTGSMTTEPLAGRLDLKGSRLDLRAILGALPSKERPAGAPLLPEPMRRRIEQGRFEATLAIDQVSAGKLVASGLAAQADLANGVLEVPSARAALWGGEAVLENGRFDLRQVLPGWSLGASLRQIDLGQALRELSGAGLLDGRLDARVAVSGAGIDWSQLAQSAEGSGSLTMKQGSLNTIDLAEEIARSLVGATSPFGSGAGSSLELPGTTTPLRDLRTTFAIRSGWMRLSSPMELGSSFGRLRLTGAIGLDEKLDLTGEASLTPQFVAQVTGGALRPASAIKVPLEIEGELRAPQVRVEPRGLLRAITASPGGRARRSLDDALDALPDPGATPAPRDAD